MKHEHLFIYIGMIGICFALWGLMSCTKYYIVYPKADTVNVCDTSELVKVRKELKKKSSDLYWVVRQRDSLRIECHEKDGIIGDTNVFKRMYFDNEGRLIEAK